MDPVFERDNRIFMGFIERDMGRARVVEIGTVVVDRAASYDGPPSGAQWFRAWIEVVREIGSEREVAAVDHALSNVQKVKDAGF